MLFHGVVVFFTFQNTYDAYVHIFFGSHYAEHWFDHWNYKWYTGFTVTSYPPLIHQLIALLSYVVGLKLAFVILCIAATALFIRGVYVFSKLWVDEKSAGVASLLAAVSSSFTEALHVFGQLPSITGIALLLNLSPYVYSWIRGRSKMNLILSLSYFAVITATHHVTTIFGMVFFIFPVIGLAIMDNAIEEKGDTSTVGLIDFARHLIYIIKPGVILGVCTLIIAIMMIFPYWVWSANDPISQVPIPHGSRDSFLDEFSSGLVFFIIPWGMMLFFLPFLFKIIYQKRSIILALSFTLAFILGTGNTTPIPLLILRENAFNILTLDRFTYWASIIALPFYGYFIRSMFAGNFKEYLQQKLGKVGRKIFAGSWLFGIFLVCGLVINVGYFQPMQPKTVDIEPLLNFLERDNHDKWRFMTLGFGDQMAWLSANTDALTVDGNYHSARRLDELTTRKVERLESAKYMQLDGINALHQFLTIPEKYQLKYIFCNDRFYNPILHFSGWQKLRNLENNIQVWEKPDITSLPSILPRKEIPSYQQYMWSTLPLSSVGFLLLMLCVGTFLSKKKSRKTFSSPTKTAKRTVFPNMIVVIWAIILSIFILVTIGYSYTKNQDQYSPENVVSAYFDALDFKRFEKAFRYYHQDHAPSLEQMLLDLSQEDGVTLSFSKLDTIELKTEVHPSEKRARVNVKAEWITSINQYTTYHSFDLIQDESKWWLHFDERNLKTPPEQLFSTSELTFKNQGSRQALLNEVAHSDILDRPEHYIKQANLVKKDGKYSIVGNIMNIDNDPSYITVSGTLIDRNGKKIVSYNTKDVIVHQILPKGETSFRIDFEDIYFQESRSEFPVLSQHVKGERVLEKPSDFQVSVKTLAIQDLPYVHVGVSDVKYDGTTICAQFNNTGTKECNIPKVLTTYYADQNLIWVNNSYLEKAVRPQRSRVFNVDMISASSVQSLYEGHGDNLFINGMSNNLMKSKFENLAGNNRTEKYEGPNDMTFDLQLSSFVVTNLK